MGILTKTAAGRERVGGDDDFSQFVIRLEDATFDTLFRDSCWEAESFFVMAVAAL